MAGYIASAAGEAVGSAGTEKGADLRFAELAIWYSPALRLWVQYDNGFTLDNSRLPQMRFDAPALYAGGRYDWAGRFTTRVEGGWREADGVGQTLVRAEQMAFLVRPVALRMGGWLGAGSDGQTELIWHGGLTLVIAQRLRIEPTFYYTPSQGGRLGDESRGLLFAEYHSPEGWRVGVGAASGIAEDALRRDRLINGILSLAAPITGGHEARLFLHREVIRDRQARTSIAVGMTLRLGGR